MFNLQSDMNTHHQHSFLSYDGKRWGTMRDFYWNISFSQLQTCEFYFSIPTFNHWVVGGMHAIIPRGFECSIIFLFIWLAGSSELEGSSSSQSLWNLWTPSEQHALCVSFWSFMKSDKLSALYFIGSLIRTSSPASFFLSCLIAAKREAQVYSSGSLRKMSLSK